MSIPSDGPSPGACITLVLLVVGLVIGGFAVAQGDWIMLGYAALWNATMVAKT